VRLTGSWAENNHHNSAPTSSRRSPSPTETETDTTNDHASSTQDRPSSVKEQDEVASESSTGAQSRKGSVYLDAVSEPSDSQSSINEMKRGLREMPDVAQEHEQDDQVITPDIASLNVEATSSPLPSLLPSAQKTRILRHSFSSSTIPSSAVRPTHRFDEEVEAVVELHEESAAALQDFLFWAYPHLDCRVSWTNVEAVSFSFSGWSSADVQLVALSTKLLVPALQGICYNFLLSHASGKPIVALSLAEEYSHADLYREASRFVLDQRESLHHCE